MENNTRSSSDYSFINRLILLIGFLLIFYIGLSIFLNSTVATLVICGSVIIIFACTIVNLCNGDLKDPK